MPQKTTRHSLKILENASGKRKYDKAHTTTKTFRGQVCMLQSFFLKLIFYGSACSSFVLKISFWDGNGIRRYGLLFCTAGCVYLDHRWREGGYVKTGKVKGYKKKLGRRCVKWRREKKGKGEGRRDRGGDTQKRRCKHPKNWDFWEKSKVKCGFSGGLRSR